MTTKKRESPSTPSASLVRMKLKSAATSYAAAILVGNAAVINAAVDFLEAAAIEFAKVGQRG